MTVLHAQVTKSHEVLAGTFEREGDVEVFFNWQGIVHHVFIPEGIQSTLLACLPEEIHLKYSQMWVVTDWALLHDSAPA
jgi:hypothetical protein